MVGGIFTRAGFTSAALRFPKECVAFDTMKFKFAAFIEAAPEGGYWAVCPEVPGANGQGDTIDAARLSLRDAIQLVFEDRLEVMRRGLPEDAIRTVVASSLRPCPATSR